MGRGDNVAQLIVLPKLVVDMIKDYMFLLQFRKFDMKQIKTYHPVIFFIGKPGATIPLDYLYHHQDIPIGCCVSPNEKYEDRQVFTGHIPDIFIHNQYSSDLMEKFVWRQKNISGRRVSDQTIDNRAFLILDDCIDDDHTWTNDKNVRFMFLNSRHYGITFFLCMSYLYNLPPYMRANIDYLFISAGINSSIKHKLYQYCGGMFPTYKMFNQFFTDCTKDGRCLVIDNCTISNRLLDRVFWYKPGVSESTKFRLCPRFWDLSA
jgi:hypothetical protein